MKFYHNPVSVPCRAVLLLMQTINLQPEMITIDWDAGDHLSPEFIEMNPQHAVPVLEDDGFVLTESRAILGYLAEKYAMDMQLYPSEPMARGIVNQRLFFDTSRIVQPILMENVGPFLYGHEELTESSFERLTGEINAAFSMLTTLMGNDTYISGDKMTIADFSIIATFSSIEQVGFDMSSYPQLLNWYTRMQSEMSGYKVNSDGAQVFGNIVRKMICTNLDENARISDSFQCAKFVTP